jgi:hypothetical protein
LLGENAFNPQLRQGELKEDVGGQVDSQVAQMAYSHCIYMNTILGLLAKQFDFLTRIQTVVGAGVGHAQHTVASDAIGGVGRVGG